MTSFVCVLHSIKLFYVMCVADLCPGIVDTVPVLLEAMLPLTSEAAQPLVSCAAVFYGGASMSEALGDQLRALGVRLFAQYGQTELGGMALIGGVASLDLDSNIYHHSTVLRVALI